MAKKKQPKAAVASGDKIPEAANIEFALFAPYNESAILQGTFSDWKDIPMQKGPDGYHRAQVALKDGAYQYKFKLQSRSWFLPPNEWVTISDPYAVDIDNPTQNGVVRVKDGKRIVDGYVWQHDDKPLPADTDLIIYEMHVGDFSGGEDDPFIRGKYTDVIAKLDYLADLGINAIEMMPLKEYPGDHSWGYNPRYFFATESAYGETEDLKRLIDECHNRGIRVIIDGVYNHSEVSSPLTQIDHDYWYHHSPRDPEFTWGPEFNYEFHDEALDVRPAWKFIGDVVRYWVQEYHTDGIRYDAARQIGNFDFFRWIVNETRQLAHPKPFYNVAEYIPASPEITGIDGPMDGCWHEPFIHTITNYLCTGECNLEEMKDVLDAKRAGYPGPTNVVNYLGNHDHDRLITRLAAIGIFDDEAFLRARLGATLLMTAFGLPFIWMGDEFGEYKEKRPDQNKIEWALLASEHNQGLHAHYKTLIALRKSAAALRSENIVFFHENVEQKVLAYYRWSGDESHVVVVVNLSGENLDGYTIPDFPHDGGWHEWLNDYEVEVNGNQLTMDLGARQAHIFVRS